MTTNKSQCKETGDCIDHTDPEVLEGLYHDEGLTLSEIADLSAVSEGGIWHHMDKHDIKTRSRSSGPEKTVPENSFRTRTDGYEVWAISGAEVLVHRLLAISEYGFDAVAGSEVHHKKDIEWLNVPWNLEPLTTTEHIRKHSELDESDIEEMRRLKSQGLYDREIAERFDMSRSGVNSIINGVVWKDV